MGAKSWYPPIALLQEEQLDQFDGIEVRNAEGRQGVIVGNLSQKGSNFTANVVFPDGEHCRYWLTSLTSELYDFKEWRKQLVYE